MIHILMVRTKIEQLFDTQRNGGRESATDFNRDKNNGKFGVTQTASKEVVLPAEQLKLAVELTMVGASLRLWKHKVSSVRVQWKQLVWK